MTYNEIKEQAEKIKWWHSIQIPSDDGQVYTTKGEVDHCSEELATSRFGMPLDLTGKSVLDIGCWDGYFSFLAEKRGASYVLGIDMLQGCSHHEQGTDGFFFAKNALNSNVNFLKASLEEYALHNGNDYDVVFYYGVLYHVENPIAELKHLSGLTKDYALIETAISQKNEINRPFWEFLNGFDNDHTNFWYPNILGLVSALLYVGFKKVQVIYNDGIRATVKAYKND